MTKNAIIHPNLQKMLITKRLLTLFFALCFSSFIHIKAQTQSVAKMKIEQYLDSLNASFPVIGTVKLNRISLSTKNKEVEIYLNTVLAYIPMRTRAVEEITEQVSSVLGDDFKEYKISIYSNKKQLKSLIPNIYRANQSIDSARLPKINTDRAADIVQISNELYNVSAGLKDKNIALWHSHGWYYEPSLDRWEWQRARAFQTVEDILPMSFVLPYLTPMLENAGANVFLPRERDWQTNEIIVDNDGKVKNQYYEISLSEKYQWKTTDKKGFGVGEGVYAEEMNPFALGTSKYSTTSEKEMASVKWIPQIPEKGDYAVYISYQSLAESTESAFYTVKHSGGETVFKVNQKIGGGTWLYLGTFYFEKGRNEQEGAVLLSNFSTDQDKIITADAVRFGGGMGNVSRNGKVSGFPRFLEASRYYFQYAGIHDTLVYHLNENNDYKDDYQSRGEWVNYLKGAPFGPEKNREAKGLGIPVDLSLAFHTDAGFTRNDTVVGTLMIHSTAADEGLFPDGVSRMANRDFADILQTQIVEDLRLKYDSTWTRRGLWDKDYSEAFRPAVPSALLELLSHHNYLDMKFALDPRFRFDVSRSVYKGILKYLSDSHNEPCVVQPLPIQSFQTEIIEESRIKLSWKATLDSLEPTAKPEGYIVYKALGNKGFDNGIFTENTNFIFDKIELKQIYRFKIIAVNKGGESFPSEILSACIYAKEAPTAFIVNAFDRVCAPASINTEKFMGFINFLDEGVPDKYDLSFVGEQYDFNPDSPWLDDDAPGHGASHSDYETQVIAGNTFNFPYIHGKALKDNGYSFASSSDESVENGEVNLSTYAFVDWILGEEKSTPMPKYLSDTSFRAFPQAAQWQIKKYLDSGGKLFVSGAYIGTDLEENKPKNHPDIKFANEVLKLKWRTNHASKKGIIKSVDKHFSSFKELKFNNTFNKSIYKVEAPDAIEPASSEGKTVFRYSNSKSAGVAYKGKYSVISLGFPFETILEEKIRVLLMKDVIRYFNSKRN